MASPNVQVDQLRAGGVFILGDVGRFIFDGDKKQLAPRFPSVSTDPVQGNGSWLAGWQDLWFQISKTSYLPMDALLQDGLFSSIFSRRYFCPIGWTGDLENGAEMGEIMLKNSLASLTCCVGKG